jgi:hypothetical protein
MSSVLLNETVRFGAFFSLQSRDLPVTTKPKATLLVDFIQADKSRLTVLSYLASRGCLAGKWQSAHEEQAVHSVGSNLPF